MIDVSVGLNVSISSNFTFDFNDKWS